MIKCYCRYIALTAVIVLSVSCGDKISTYDATYNYINAERTSEIIVNSDFFETGPPIASDGSFDPELERLGGEIDDCGTNLIRCRRAGVFVFAVPSESLSVGDKYHIAGADLSIHSCIYKSGNGCERVVVISVCHRVDKRSRCDVDGEEIEVNLRSSTIFIYDIKDGILSIGFGSPSPDDCELGRKAREYVLRQKRGLLHAKTE